MRAGRAVRLCVGVLVCVLGPMSAARVQADDSRIYRWVDANGQVHFSETPPNGSAAREWAEKSDRVQVVPSKRVPDPETTRQSGTQTNSDLARDVFLGRVPQSLSPVEQPSRASSKASRPTATDHDDEDACRGAIQWRDAIERQEARIEALEASLERTRDSDVMLRTTQCARERSWNSATPCQSTTFNREKAVEDLEDQIERAEEQLRRMEEDARNATSPQGCPGT